MSIETDPEIVHAILVSLLVTAGILGIPMLFGYLLTKYLLRRLLK